MFTEKAIMFMYAVTPVHMGAGSALGVIDNPIQRERHSEHPFFAGSGIKGALRDAGVESMGKEMVIKVFGPEKSGAEHAGAASFSDGQIVAFPVRSLKEGYVYLTSPFVLERFFRLARIVGLNIFDSLSLPPLSDTQALVLNDKLLANGQLVLESYAFEKAADSEKLKPVAQWLAQNALPQNDSAHKFFSEKLGKDLVMVNDTQFSFFVRNSTVVEPHVRIDDETGTAEDGGLFFTENLPPESLMVSLVMASIERRKKGESPNEPTPAKKILETIMRNYENKIIQIGGDATTGRGQVVLHFLSGK